MQSASGLFGSATLEVAIGLAFVFFTLSVVCSSIIEFFASVLHWRANDLEKALVNLLGTDDLLQRVIAHPLIIALGHNDRPAGQQTAGAAGGDAPPASKSTTLPGQPSYLPPKTFALALLDSIVNPDGNPREELTVNNLRSKIGQLTQADEQRVGKALLTLMQDSRNPTAVAARIDALKDSINKLPPTDPNNDNKVRLASAAIGPLRDLDDIDNVLGQTLAFDPDLLRVAQGLVQNTRKEVKDIEYSVDQLQTNVETWFDNAMDRMSGAYKRKIQWFMLIVGFVVTVGSGADALHIATTLFANPALRGELVAAASATSQGSQPPSPSISDTLEQLSPFYQLFGYEDVRQLARATPDAPQPNPWVFWIEKIAGLAITAFAILLGGPFWFDMLQKLVNLRGSGPKPDRSDAPASPVTSTATTSASSST
jgi:hypothetical protein